MKRQTAYRTLEMIAKIKDPEERKVALRSELLENNALAIAVQYTYHPFFEWDLPPGPLPKEIARKSNHDEYGPFYSNIRRLKQFQKGATNTPQHKKEANFISIYEGVADQDADLLIAMKDKKLPWKELSAEFVADAIPELFPPSFRPSTPKSTDPQPAKEFKGGSVSNSEVARQLIQANPNITRKEFLDTLKGYGAKNSTASLYWQKFKVK